MLVLSSCGYFGPIYHEGAGTKMILELQNARGKTIVLEINTTQHRFSFKLPGGGGSGPLISIDGIRELFEMLSIQEPNIEDRINQIASALELKSGQHVWLTGPYKITFDERLKEIFFRRNGGELLSQWGQLTRERVLEILYGYEVPASDGMDILYALTNLLGWPKNSLT